MIPLLVILLNLPFIYGYFPYGKCFVKDCMASPYTFQLTKTDNKSMCWVVQPQECTDTSKYDCCTILQNVQKFTIPAKVECGTRPISGVTFNSTRKGGGVYFDIYDGYAELRVTSINIPLRLFIGTEICVELASSCPIDPLVFFTDINFEMKFAPFNPDIHTCCPTCLFQQIDKQPLEPSMPLQPSLPLLPQEPSLPLQPSWPMQPSLPVQPSWPLQQEPSLPLQPSWPLLPQEPSLPLQPSLPLLPQEPSLPLQPSWPMEPSLPLQPSWPLQPTQSFCGNTICEDDENIRLCPKDCNPICGNGICEFAEDFSRCLIDCPFQI